MDNIESIKPDRIVVWNGWFPWCHAATKYLKEKYKHVYHVELAWLPQKGHIFLDHKDCGGRSILASTGYYEYEHLIQEDKALALVESLKNHEKYAPRGVDISKKFMKEGFVLVPLQIWNDTSILYDSPYFKEMASFIGWVRRQLPTANILVKPHPKDTLEYKVPHVHYAKKGVDVSALVPHAKAIVALNSTSVIEALIHNKPIAVLADNVACNKGVYHELPASYLQLEPHLYKEPDRVSAAKTLFFLHSNQFPSNNPPDWLIRKILSTPEEWDFVKKAQKLV